MGRQTAHDVASASNRSVASACDLPLHQVPVMAREQYEMIKTIPARSGRSAWKNEECRQGGLVQVDKQEATCPRCGGALLRPVVLEPDGRIRLVRGFRNSSYRRMNPTKPAATVTTASNRISSDNTVHPWENRVLSAWECQMLQGFPTDFKWGEVLDAGHIGLIRAMIGEAVPPQFTARHGQVLTSVMDGGPFSAIPPEG